MPPETPPSFEAPAPAPAPKPPHSPLPIIFAVLLLLVAGGVLWFLLTRETPAPPGEPLNTGSTAPIKQHLTDDGTYYEIDAAYPSSTPLAESASPAADAKAVATMKKFETDEIASFKADSGLDSLTAEDIQMQGLGPNRKYGLGIDYETFSSTVTLSFVYEIYSDTLGAHPNTYYRTFTFDAASGSELALKDLFVPGYLNVLANEAKNRLPAIVKEQSGGYDADPDMLALGITPEAVNFQSFYLDGANLVIIFPPYQIGPYALGTILLPIPRADLGNALKAQYR